MTKYIGIDFEYANKNKASICSYGLAFEDGTQEHGFIRLHEDAPLQRHTFIHGITQEQTDSGAPFPELYARIAELTADGDTILIAHDLKSDRRAWLAAQAQHGLTPLPLSWIDSLPIARAELGLGKGAGAGIAIMAARYGIEIDHHNAADDALISLEIIKRNPPTKNILQDGSAAANSKKQQHKRKPRGLWQGPLPRPKAALDS